MRVGGDGGAPTPALRGVGTLGGSRSPECAGWRVRRWVFRVTRDADPGHADERASWYHEGWTYRVGNRIAY